MTDHGHGTDPWEATGLRWASSALLPATGDSVGVPCHACGYPTLSAHGAGHVCVVCHWKDDGSTRERPDRPSEVNHGLTLREAATNVVDGGVSASPWDAMTRPEFFLPAVRSARAALMAAYDRLLTDPTDATARADVRTGRAAVMRAIVNEMHVRTARPT